MKWLLLSGGLDSACMAWLERSFSHGEPFKAIFINYGQHNEEYERKAVKHLCDKLSIPLLELELPNLFKGISSSILTGSSKHTVEKDELPNRNATMIMIASAQMHSGDSLYIGVHKTRAPYIDCSKSFTKALANFLLKYTSNAPIYLQTPYVGMSKERLLKHAVNSAGMGIEDVRATVSCYEGIGCGKCPACIQRAKILKSTFGVEK